MMSTSLTPHLGGLDLAIIIFYIAANSLIGFITVRRHKPKSDAEDFILAGRTLTIPAFVATLVTMWYGGVLGVGEFSYDKGIVMWVVFGIPYYAAALLFAFFLAHRVNSDRANATIPDRLRSTYGERTGYLGAGIVFFLTSPAGYIMTLGTLYQWFFWNQYDIRDDHCGRYSITVSADGRFASTCAGRFAALPDNVLRLCSGSAIRLPNIWWLEFYCITRSAGSFEADRRA